MGTQQTQQVSVHRCSNVSGFADAVGLSAMRSKMSSSGLIGLLSEDLLQILYSSAMPFVHVDSPTGSMEHWQPTPHHIQANGFSRFVILDTDSVRPSFRLIWTGR